MDSLFLCRLELQMIIILYAFPGNSTTLSIFHDLSFKKINNTLSMHTALGGFLSERGQINEVTCGQ